MSEGVEHAARSLSFEQLGVTHYASCRRCGQPIFVSNWSHLGGGDSADADHRALPDLATVERWNSSSPTVEVRADDLRRVLSSADPLRYWEQAERGKAWVRLARALQAETGPGRPI